MDGGVLKGLNDKLYEKRKASALEVEKYYRKISTGSRY